MVVSSYRIHALEYSLGISYQHYVSLLRVAYVDRFLQRQDGLFSRLIRSKRWTSVEIREPGHELRSHSHQIIMNERRSHDVGVYLATING